MTKAIFGAVLTMLVALTFGAQAADTAGFIGTWKLTIAKNIDADGKPQSDTFGPNPLGFITYSADKRMMVVITTADRPKFAGDRLSAKLEDQAKAYATGFGYAGTYTFDGKKVSHMVDAATNPNQLGTVQTRFATFKDKDTLALTTEPISMAGKMVVIELIWSRVK